MQATRWLGVLFLCVLLAGCGATTSVSTGGNPTATAPQPTATATPTPLPTPSASQLAACGLVYPPGVAPTGVSRVGDLLVTGGSTGFSYPSRKLPDGTPPAPFHLAGWRTAAPEAQIPSDPAVNPYLGYAPVVCNSSLSQTHVLKGVGVRIQSATPYSGQVNAWNICDSPYDASTKQVGDGCGAGGICAQETLKATFDSATAGANATVTQEGWSTDGCGGDVFGPLPFSLKPHQHVLIYIGVAMPSTVGTFRFAFGLAQDTSATVFLPATGPILLAPVAHKWTGAACLKPAMQSQIPAASSPTYYICPES